MNSSFETSLHFQQYDSELFLWHPDQMPYLQASNKYEPKKEVAFSSNSFHT